MGAPRAALWSFAWVLFVFLRVPIAIGASEATHITLVLRYDDYSTVSPTELEVRMLHALKNHAIPLTVGVIPAICDGGALDTRPRPTLPLTAEKAAILRDSSLSGDIEVAIHGFSHQTRRVVEPTELIGLKLETQRKLMQDGRKIVDEQIGRPSRVFIPPWNSFDENTLRAAEETGFDGFSAGWPTVPGVESSLHFLPATCELAELRDAIAGARRIDKPGTTIVALFHPYDFREFAPMQASFDMEAFDATLAWLSEQSDVVCLTLSAAIDVDKHLSVSRYCRWRQTRTEPTRWILPPLLKTDLRCYPSDEALESIAAAHWRALALWFGGLAALPAIVGVYVSRFFIRRVAMGRTRLRLAAVLISCLTISSASLTTRPGWVKIAGAVLAVGASVGLLLGTARPISLVRK